MMDFIMVPTIMAIITLGIYKLFELFVCRADCKAGHGPEGAPDAD